MAERKRKLYRERNISTFANGDVATSKRNDDISWSERRKVIELEGSARRSIQPVVIKIVEEVCDSDLVNKTILNAQTDEEGSAELTAGVTCGNLPPPPPPGIIR